MNYQACIVIPCRFGNQEIKDKNLQRILNVSLIERTLTHAITLNIENSRICVSTNNYEKFLNGIEGTLVETLVRTPRKSANAISTLTNNIDFHKRPSDLATPESPIIDTLCAIRQSYLSKGTNFNYWILMQPTSPFRNKSELMSVSSLIANNASDHFSFISLTNVSDFHPARMYQFQQGKLTRLQEFREFELSRRQDLREVYIRDGAFYISSDKLIKSKLIIGESPEFIIREYPWDINIDRMKDLAHARSVRLSEVQADPNSSGPNFGLKQEEARKF